MRKWRQNTQQEIDTILALVRDRNMQRTAEQRNLKTSIIMVWVLSTDANGDLTSEAYVAKFKAQKDLCVGYFQLVAKLLFAFLFYFFSLLTFAFRLKNTRASMHFFSQRINAYMNILYLRFRTVACCYEAWAILFLLVWLWWLLGNTLHMLTYFVLEPIQLLAYNWTRFSSILERKFDAADRAVSYLQHQQPQRSRDPMAPNHLGPLDVALGHISQWPTSNFSHSSFI